MKKLLLLLILALCAPMTFAQNVPSYVPTNGLVGYWPFNGNANDESGNGNNGTNNGATLTADRFGNSNSAYSFDGVNDFIICNNNNMPTQSMTISAWVYQQDSFANAEYICLGSANSTKWGLIASNNNINLNYGRGCSGSGGSNLTNSPINLGEWNHLVYVSSGVGGTTQIYKNGVFIGQTTANTVGSCSTQNLYFGVDIFSIPEYINGKLDDIGIWDRALTQEEITNLYNANQCITNITVTDTLIINVGQLSYNNPVTWANNITIAPNPASSQININFNNITDLNGGTIKIINSLGQEVANTPITISGTNTTMPITAWGGKGLYFVQIINPQGQIVDIKKIILQ
jgi:hypothetical protein